MPAAVHTQPVARHPIGLKGPVAVEVQQVDCRQLAVGQTLAQALQRGRAQQLDGHRASVDLRLKFVQQLAGDIARVDKAGALGPRDQQQHPQWRVERERQGRQVTFGQAANDRDWGAPAQDQEAAPVVEQFPGQAQRRWDVALDADLARGIGVQVPGLGDPLRVGALEQGIVEAPADDLKLALDRRPAHGELLVGPLPILLQVPAQLGALLVGQQFGEQAGGTLAALGLAAQLEAGQRAGRRVGGRRREGDAEIEEVGHGEVLSVIIE